MTTNKNKKRPITEALLHAEDAYVMARQQIKRMCCEVAQFRTSFTGEDGSIPRGLITHLDRLESDLTRHSKQLQSMEDEYRDSKQVIQRFATTKLENYETFQVFLHAFHPKCDQARVQVLLRGHETTIAIKKKIADYVGAPTGKSLHDIVALEKTIKSSLPVKEDTRTVHSSNAAFSGTKEQKPCKSRGSEKEAST